MENTLYWAEKRNYNTMYRLWASWKEITELYWFSLYYGIMGVFSLFLFLFLFFYRLHVCVIIKPLNLVFKFGYNSLQKKANKNFEFSYTKGVQIPLSLYLINRWHHTSYFWRWIKHFCRNNQRWMELSSWKHALIAVSM